MRRFSLCVESGTGDAHYEEFELDDDATESDIEAAAKDIFFNICNYGWIEIIDGGV